MTNLRASTAQFENKSGDKDYNLSVIDRLSAEAALKGSQVISFHECSITGYTFARHLSKEQMLEIAEYIPSGPSIKKLHRVITHVDLREGHEQVAAFVDGHPRLRICDVEIGIRPVDRHRVYDGSTRSI